MRNSSSDPSAALERRIARIQHGGEVSIPDLKRKLLSGQGVEARFSLVSAPISPFNQTSFVALEDNGQLLIGVSLLETKQTAFPHSPITQDRYAGTVEILFDPRCDGLGFCHYLFSSDGTVSTHDFSPYPDARSSRWQLPRVVKSEFESQLTGTERGYLVHWLWVRFDMEELFRYSDVIGFNVCREDGNRGEWSAWNFAAGFGFPDAQSLGFLCRGLASPLPSLLPLTPRAPKFSITMLNDIPDGLIMQPYSPAAIDAEMKALRSWGVDRAEWIDYSNLPAFWGQPVWSKSYQETLANCPDLIGEAVQAAHRHGLKFIADVKLFDLALVDFQCSPETPGALKLWDGGVVAGAPEMTGMEDAFMQSNPGWRSETHFPIQGLRFYSNTEIPAIEAGEVIISVSKDNRNYTLLDPASYSVKVSCQRRRHVRWELDGRHDEEGDFPNWMLEISGLDCRTPFVEIVCDHPGLKFTNPAFLFVEAEDALGNIAPVEISQKLFKSGPARFSFHPSWQGWGNHNEWVVKPATWGLSPLCLAFVDPPSLSGLLEPTHPEARRLWLGRIQALLDRGVDGISLRLLCHHNNATSWLKYAFGPTVLDAFSKSHGRLPGATEEDYLEIRRIRGGAITELLRDIRQRCSASGCKVIFQIETGFELPPEIGNRMHIHFDYEAWMQEGLVDEFHVRAITGHSPWLRGHLLPLARKFGVQVHLVSRNLHSGLDAQAIPVFERIVGDAVEAGYDGFTFYEAAGLYEIGPEDTLVARGLAQPTVEAAVRRAARSSG